MLGALALPSITARRRSGTVSIPDANALTWAPPVLDSPLTVNVDVTGDVLWNGRSTYPATGTYSTSQDLIVVFPAEKRIGTVRIMGGRNIVIIGGHMTANPDQWIGQDTIEGVRDGRDTIALYVETTGVGVIHIEGMLIDASAGGGQDGINCYAPNCILQVQNCYIEAVGQNDDPTYTVNNNDGVHGEGYHAYYPTGPARFDKVTIATDLNGMTLIGRRATVKRVNTKWQSFPWNNNSINNEVQWFFGMTAGSEGRTSNYCQTEGLIELEDCYCAPAPDKTLLNSTIPTSSLTSSETGTCPSTGTTSERFFPYTTLTDGVTPGITGSVKLGPPPGGDFCLITTPGIGYVSPGYLNQPIPPEPVPEGASAYVTEVQSTTPGTTHTFSATAVGTAHGLRQTVLAIGFSGASGTNNPTGVTVGGVAASLIINTTSSSSGVSFWKVFNPTGTTADIVVTFGASASTCAVAVWEVHEMSTVVLNAKERGDSNSAVLAAVADGFAVAASLNVTASDSPSWSGVDVSSTTAISTRKFSAADAHTVSSASLTISAGWPVYSQPRTACVSFSPL